MKKHIKSIILLFSLAIVFNGCQENDYSFGEIVAPSNIQITASIVGADAANPNGDGSGEVVFTATADNAVSYKFFYKGGEAVSLSGEHTVIFSDLGLNTYTVTVVASGIAGVSSSNSIQVDVLATYSPPADLKTKLFGFDPANPNAVTSRTFKIQEAKPQHFGLGPVGGSVICEWYGAGPSEKAGVGMYDDRFTFSSDGTFTYVTNGDVFGRNGLMDAELGPLGGSGGTLNGDDIEGYSFGDYTGTFTLTAPGGVETITLSDNSHIGYYIGGNHQYEIFDRAAANEFVLRSTDGNGTFDWWFIIVAE
ncbi:MAG: glucan endo-1,3-beta-D-glucosidase [Flavobacteriaceae bacterium]|nr:glucan endo-1,3-beta-D-glucosidase [Flavobacteriaceae bacterium]|tara:strand:- start:31144 stop:32064 length:921 start_codon:yes stop_codon:yes gene_type:complete